MDRVEEEAQAAAQINGENRRWKGQEGAGTLCLHPSASAAMHPMLARATHRPRPDKRLCAVSQARSRLLQTHMHGGCLCACPLGFCLATADSTCTFDQPPHWCPTQRCSRLARCLYPTRLPRRLTAAGAGV
jgi:hypothetical protein